MTRIEDAIVRTGINDPHHPSNVRLAETLTQLDAISIMCRFEQDGFKVNVPTDDLERASEIVMRIPKEDWPKLIGRLQGAAVDFVIATCV